MKGTLKKKAIANAVILTNKYGLDPHFVSEIIDGRLYYSVALYPQKDGGCIEIDRNGTGTFSKIVRRFERNTSSYVYHCILSGPFLTLLFVSYENAEILSMEQDEYYAAVFDIDARKFFFMDVKLERCEDALVRVD